MTEQELIAALSGVWTGGGQPEYIVCTSEGAWEEIRLVNELERICTPAGLKALFPGLH